MTSRHEPSPGMSVILTEDPRLTWPERELVRRFGAKLYGRRASAPNG
jgi:hypothetical protein